MQSAPWPFVEIEWLDAVDLSGWKNVKKLKARHAPKMVTRGFLVAENDTTLWVATTYDIEDPCVVSSVGGIPRGFVTGMKVIDG